MRRVSILYPALAVAFLATLAGCATVEPVKSDGVGVDATEVRATDLEKAFKEQKGKVILVDCWATWCGPCVKKFPHFVATHKKYADKGLVCMSICLDKSNVPEEYTKEKVLKFLKDKGATFPNFIVIEPRKDAEALDKLVGDLSAIPYMTMFDRAGKRVWASDEKPLKDDQLDTLIEEQLAKK